MAIEFVLVEIVLFETVLVGDPLYLYKVEIFVAQLYFCLIAQKYISTFASLGPDSNRVSISTKS